MKILSVDDSVTIRRIIQGSVSVLGYDFLEAANGRQALEVLTQHPGDVGLVLLDWNMPELDGYETLLAMKKDGRFRSIPVVMVTTVSERENIAKAIAAGATHYVTKPFTQEDLSATIMECLGQGEASA